MTEQQKPPARGGRLKKRYEAIVRFAAFRLVRHLYRVQFGASLPPESFAVLPAVKNEVPSSPQNRRKQTDSKPKLMILS